MSGGVARNRGVVMALEAVIMPDRLPDSRTPWAYGAA